MAIDLDTSRAFRTPDELLALVEAVRDADAATPEPDWLEWKSQADLKDKRWHAELARQIAGSANRMLATAEPRAEGCGYVLVGVEPGGVAGVTPIDPANLVQGIGRFVRARWSSDYVSIDGAQVLVVTVEPPRPGDGIVAIHREYSGGGGTIVRDGDVFVRRAGQTRRASAADLAELVERAQSALREQVAAATVPPEPPITIRGGGSSADDLTIGVEVNETNRPQQARIAILQQGFEPSPVEVFRGRPARDGRWEITWRKIPSEAASPVVDGVYDDGFGRRFEWPGAPPRADTAWVVLSYDRADGIGSSFWQLWRMKEGGSWSLGEAAARPLWVQEIENG